MRGALRKPRTPGGSWAYRIDLGIGGDGKRMQKQVAGFRTKRDAEAAMNEAMSQLQRGAYVPPSKGTFAEYFAVWQEAIKPEVAESAWRNYRWVLRTYVLPRLGPVRLIDLHPARIQGMYAELLAGGGRKGRPLSPRTVLQVHRTLHRAMEDAVRWRELPGNPVDGVRAPRIHRKEMLTWTAAEANRFLTLTADDRLHAAWVLALHTGMRRGELAGLRWKDVSFERGDISVNQQRTTAEYNVVTIEPKAGSRRVIAIDEDAVNAMRAHHRRQTAERLQAGPDWPDSGYVFVDEIGEPIHPERLSDLYCRARDTLGMPRIRLHDLRHTMATLALQAGVHPKVVQERLGHSSIAMTLDLYSHVSPSLQRDAAQAIARILAG